MRGIFFVDNQVPPSLPDLNKLTEDQKDVLAEIFNMGMGQSLNLISQISGKEHEITFNLPSVELIELDSFLNKLTSDKSLGIIKQDYNGNLKGQALMFYPEISGKKLAKLLIGSEIPEDQIDKLEVDALLEIGNIFINSSLACLANFMEIEIKTDIPKIIYSEALDLKQLNNSNLIFELQAPFQIEHYKISGKIAFIIDNKSTQTLLKAIDDYVNEFE